ncbi:MAG: hypothetical protein WBO06_07450 [Gammaproteobacteria bacterium]
MASMLPELVRIARLLDGETAPEVLNEALDELEFLYDAVTNSEMQDAVSDLIGRLRKKLQDTG